MHAHFAAAVLAAMALLSPAGSIRWPSFRGEAARGISEGAPLPITWNVERGEGVRWRTPLPGLGHSSPAIWGNRLFVTAAVSGNTKPQLKVGLYGDVAPLEENAEHEWRVICLDKRDGRILWQQTACRGVPRIKRHPKATHANCTVAVDGKRLVAFFGSEGLYCYDLDGRLLWKKDLGVLDSGFYLMPGAQWGFASSPVLHDGLVIVQCDVQKDGFLAAFRAADGSESWRTPRNDVPTWSSPTVHVERGRAQVIVNGWKHIGGYDLETGKEVWRMTGGGDIPVPTPIVGHGLVFITNAHGAMAPIYAIRTSAQGEISLAPGTAANAHVAWSHHREGGYMQTPLAYRDWLYVCRDHGVLSCYELKTGRRVYNERLAPGFTGFTASPVAGDGKLYFTAEYGDVYVVRAGPKFEKLSVNPLGEVCMATPAISEGVVYFRTQGHVAAISTR